MAIAEEKLREMVKAGVHIGHRKSRRHPSMMPFIFGLRGNTEIIDVSKTLEALEAAEVFLKEAVGAGKVAMFVGTRPSLAEMTKQAARELNAPYVTVRWIGGTLTNFGVISKRLDAFRQLVEQEQSGELAEKYTKAERVRFQRKIAKLQEELGGIKEMTTLPDILVISSLRSNKLAALEAKKRGILTVAIVDTDCDPKLVDYPIPANDDALPSVELILNRLKVPIAEGQKAAARAAEAAKVAALKKEQEEKEAAKIKEQNTKKEEQSAMKEEKKPGGTPVPEMLRTTVRGKQPSPGPKGQKSPSLSDSVEATTDKKALEDQSKKGEVVTPGKQVSPKPKQE